MQSCARNQGRRDPKIRSGRRGSAFLIPYIVDLRVAAAVATCATVSQMAVTRVPLLRNRVSAPVFSIVVAAACANVGLIPASHALYDIIAAELLPLACSLFLFSADLRRVRSVRTSGIAFLIGTLGTIVGSILASLLVPVGPERHRIAGLFSSTYIGGTVNYLGVARSLQITSDNPTLLATGLVVDNALMGIYLSVLFALSPSDNEEEESSTEQKGNVETNAEQHRSLFFMTAVKSGLALSMAMVICLGAGWLSSLLQIPSALTGVPIVTMLTTVLATAAPEAFRPLSEPAGKVGAAFFALFFVTVGAASNLRKMLQLGLPIMIFASIILAVHGLVMYALGRAVLRLPIRELLVASNANIGGAGTAAAFAAERGWSRLIIPAVIVGSFGYIIATPIGLLIASFLRRF